MLHSSGPNKLVALCSPLSPLEGLFITIHARNTTCLLEDSLANIDCSHPGLPAITTTTSYTCIGIGDINLCTVMIGPGEIITTIIIAALIWTVMRYELLGQGGEGVAHWSALPISPNFPAMVNGGWML